MSRAGRLRVALAAPDPERRARLARAVEDAGHAPAGTGHADVLLIDLPMFGLLPPFGAVPALVLTDQPGRAADPALAGVLPRDVPAPTLLVALEAVAAGLQVRPPPAAPPGFAAATEDIAHPLLTPREMEVLAAIGEGLSNKEVARRFGISAHTVKFHLEAVFAKLGAGSRAEAVAKGLRHGLIEL